MKKLFLFIVLFILCSIGIINSQTISYSDRGPAEARASIRYSVRETSSSGRMNIPNDSKFVEGEVTSSSSYIAGSTFDIVFECDFTPNYDDEYVDGVSLTFPTGVTVNSATDFVLEWNGETGNGITTSWGDMDGGSYDGPLYGVDTWTVNVTVDASFTGDLIIDWYAAGDGYSYYPEDAEGTITIESVTGTDLAITSITPASWLSGKTITPKVNLSNIGATDISSYSVLLVINDGTSDVYTSTFNSTEAIPALGSYVVEMPTTWTPTTGEYTMTATLTVTDDNPENNSLVQEFKAGLYQEVYAGNASNNQYQTINMSDYQFTLVNNNYPTGVFPMGEEFIGDYIYRLYTNGDIGIVTPFGDYEKMGRITGIGTDGSILSIAYDWTTETVYILCRITNGDVAGVPVIYSLNMDTYALTLIGQPGSENIATIAMDMASDGYLYAVAMTPGNVYRVDPQTGVFEVVGSHGLSLNYGQDVSYDVVSGRLYSITCGSTAANRLFGYYDINSGAFTTISDVTITTQYATLVFTNKPVGPYVASVTPENNSLDQEVDVVISTTFTVDITEVDFDLVTITPAVTGIVCSINDNVLTIAHDNLDYDTEYTVTIGAGSVSDGTDNLARDYSWSFTTKLDPTNCNPPTHLTATDINYYDVTLNWQENGPATQWNIEWGATGFEQGSGTLISETSTKPYLLSGLTDNTTYDFYVQSYCSSVEQSEWAGPFTFNTPLDCSGTISIFPWAEGFESFDISATCWTLTPVSGANWQMYTGTTYARNGSKSIYHDDVTGVQDSWLITPQISVPNDGIDYFFNFWSNHYYSTYYTEANGARNSVLISTGSSTAGSTDFVEVWFAESITNDIWVNAALALQPYAGQNIYIAFRYQGNNAHRWYIDDVSIEALEVEALTPADNAVDIAANTEISVEFNMDITSTDLTQIIIVPAVTGISASITDNVLTIAHDNLEYETSYEVTIPSGTVTGYNQAIIWSFTTAEAPPAVVAYLPTQAATDIELDAVVSLTFNKNITGADLSGITISPAVTNVVPSINGTVLSIAHDDFVYETEYTVTIPAGTIDNLSEVVTWTFTTMDDPTPVLESRTPAIDAVNVALDATVSVTFDRNINVLDLSGIIITPDVNAVAAANEAVLTITHDQFAYATEYTVTIPAGSIEYINTPITWTFTTLPALTVSNMNPANGTNDVAINAVVSVEFNRNITAVDLTGIQITDEEDQPVQNVSGSISGTLLTIAHADFDYETEYTVTIPANSIEEYSNAITWSFTTQADVPVILSYAPQVDAEDVELNAAVSVTFNRNITGTNLNQITISPSVTGVSASINGAVLTIAHGAFAYGTEYTVTIPAGTIDNYSGAISWSFTTREDPTPVISSRTPSVNATNVALDAAVSITFNRNITGTNLNQITISPSVTGVSASINGAVLTIAHADFAYGTQYTVNIPAGTIDNYSGAISWSFTTLSEPVIPSPVIVSYSPEDEEENVEIDAEVSVTFDKVISAENLNTITITPNPGEVSASVSGEKITILHGNFDNNTEYTVTIPDGVVENYSGEISWSFTTGGVGVGTNNINEISIYPNPSSGLVNILVNENAIVKVLDVTGKLLETYTVKGDSAITFTQSAGIYFVNIEINGELSTHKIIIQ